MVSKLKGFHGGQSKGEMINMQIIREGTDHVLLEQRLGAPSLLWGIGPSAQSDFLIWFLKDEEPFAWWRRWG